MKQCRTSVLWALALLLAGCSVQTPPIEPGTGDGSSAPDAPRQISLSPEVEEAAQKDIYPYTITLSPRHSMTFGRDGNVFTEDPVAELRDVLTDEVQCKMRTKRENTGKRDEYGTAIIRTTTALYDVDGALLQEYAEVSYSAGFGDYIIRRNDPDRFMKDILELGEEYRAELWNYKTGEVFFANVDMIQRLGDDKVLLRDPKGRAVGVLTEKGEKVGGFPGPQEYESLTTWNNFIIGTERDENTGRFEADVLMTEKFEPVLTRESLNGSYYGLRGNYILYRENMENPDDQVQGILIPPDNTPVFTVENGEFIHYFDGEIAVLQNKAYNYEDSSPPVYRLVQMDKTVLADGYDHLDFVETYDAKDSSMPVQAFMGIRGDTAELLDRTGTVLASAELPGVQSMEYIGDGYYTYYTEMGDLEQPDTYYGLLDSDFQILIPAGKYYSIMRARDWYTAPGGVYDLLECGRSLRDGGTVWDICDMKGQPVITDINQIYRIGPNRIAVQKGFSAGLMDWQGNWIVKQSIFTNFGED